MLFFYLSFLPCSLVSLIHFLFLPLIWCIVFISLVNPIMYCSNFILILPHRLPLSILVSGISSSFFFLFIVPTFSYHFTRYILWIFHTSCLLTVGFISLYLLKKFIRVSAWSHLNHRFALFFVHVLSNSSYKGMIVLY